MRSSVLLAVPLLLVFGCSPPEVCSAGASPSVTPLTPDPVAGLHRFAHAHNDYEHDRPLLDALSHRFYSVEADVFYASGRFEVSHGGFDGTKGTLRELYLDPLQNRVTANGSVYGDGVRFTLWIDLKDAPKELPGALEQLLSQYPMLSFSDAAGLHDGPVEVILTGERVGKTAFDAFETRHAVRDSNDFSPDDPPADAVWTAYALDWGKYVGWSGEGTPTAQQTERLTCVVAGAHEKNRRVRFYGGADRPEIWNAWIDAGVDFLGTDKLEELDALLEQHAP